MAHPLFLRGSGDSFYATSLSFARSGSAAGHLLLGSPSISTAPICKSTPVRLQITAAAVVSSPLAVSPPLASQTSKPGSHTDFWMDTLFSEATCNLRAHLQSPPPCPQAERRPEDLPYLATNCVLSFQLLLTFAISGIAAIWLSVHHFLRLIKRVRSVCTG